MFRQFSHKSFLVRLKLAFKGSWNELYQLESQLSPEILLKDMLQKIVIFDDDFWDSCYAFSRDPLGYLANKQDKIFLSHQARDCGKKFAQKVLSKFEIVSVRELIHKMNLSLERIYDAIYSGRIHFAEFVEPDNIRLYEDCLGKLPLLAEQIPRNMGILLTSAEEALIAHEIFHYLEFLEKDTIFTRTYAHPIPPILFFQRNIKFLCLGEIAAMAFVKEYLHLSFSPYVFDLLLTYSCNKDAAYLLYNYIMSLTEEKNCTEEK